MRSHRQIIKDAGGVTKLQNRYQLRFGTVQSWQTRDHIPAKIWARLVQDRLATYEELAAAEAIPRVPTPKIMWTEDAESGAWIVMIPPGAGRRAFKFAMDSMHAQYRAVYPSAR